MLNEAATIASTLMRSVAARHEQKSSSLTAAATMRASRSARPLCDSVISAPRGRACQMNAGARVSHGDALVFVHADTIVQSTFAADIASALSDPQ